MMTSNWIEVREVRVYAYDELLCGQRVMVDIYDDENEKREVKQIVMIKTFSSLGCSLYRGRSKAFR